MAKAKEIILKPLIPLCTKLANIEILRKKKVGPSMYSNTKVNRILLLRDGSLSIDRRDDEYLQARRAVLSSYHLISDGYSFKEKIKNSFKGMCRDIGTAVHARVGVRVYRFTVGCPWSVYNDDKMLVFRCFLPHLRSQKKSRT